MSKGRGSESGLHPVNGTHPLAYAISRQVDGLLPTAAAAARVGRPAKRHRGVGPTNPICDACGWQHRSVVAGRCSDEVACAKRAADWS